MNLLQILNSSVMKLSLEGYLRSRKTCLINCESNFHPQSKNLPFHFTHWLNLLTLQNYERKNSYSDLPPQIVMVTSKLEYQNLSSENFHSNPESKFTQTTDRNEKKTLILENTVFLSVCIKSLCFKLLSKTKKKMIKENAIVYTLDRDCM